MRPGCLHGENALVPQEFQRLSKQWKQAAQDQWGAERAQAARLAQRSTAKSAVPVVPTLQQKGGVEILLLAPELVELVGAALTGADRFERLAFAQGLLVGARGLLAQRFEAPDFVLELETKVVELFAQQAGKLKFRRGTSGGKRGRIGPCGIREKPFQPSHGFLSADHVERSSLQRERALVLKALTQAKEGRECETESHRRQTGRAMSRSREAFMSATSLVDCIRNSRSAGMSAMARSSSGSLFFW